MNANVLMVQAVLRWMTLALFVSIRWLLALRRAPAGRSEARAVCSAVASGPHMSML